MERSEVNHWNDLAYARKQAGGEGLPRRHPVTYPPCTQRFTKESGHATNSSSPVNGSGTGNGTKMISAECSHWCGNAFQMDGRSFTTIRARWLLRSKILS